MQTSDKTHSAGERPGAPARQVFLTCAHPDAPTFAILRAKSRPAMPPLRAAVQRCEGTAFEIQRQDLRGDPAHGSLCAVDIVTEVDRDEMRYPCVAGTGLVKRFVDLRQVRSDGIVVRLRPGYIRKSELKTGLQTRYQ